MRREEGQAADRVPGGVDERDRGAVAVADEERLGRVDLCEQHGQDVERLLVEEGRGARGARRVRVAVAEAREGEHAPAGGLVQVAREATPQPDRAEPFVQEHERAARASPGRSATSTWSPSTVAMAASVVAGTVCALRRRVRRANMRRVIGDVLWTPPADVRETTEIGRYLNWLRDERGRDLADYDELWRWSVDDLEGFWGVDLGLLRRARARAVRARARRRARCPGARVVPGRAAELRRAPARHRRGRRRGWRSSRARRRASRSS